MRAVIVLVPAYEPDHRLLSLLDALRTAVPAAHLVVVDDGSGPAHAAVFDAARARGHTVLSHPGNRGKGAALKTGVRHVAERWPGHDVVCADSDGQHSVIDVLRVAERVAVGEALVLGVRQFTGDVPARSRVGNTVTRTLFRLATGLRLQDTQTGLRGYSAALLPWLLSVPGDRFEYELAVLLQAARRGLPLEEIAIATTYLEGNASSHFRPVIDSLRVYAPLAAFLLSSLGAFLVDTVALLALHAVTDALLLSVVGARVLSSAVNFAGNRRFDFASRQRKVTASAVRYGALVVALLATGYGLLALLIWLGLALLPAKILTDTTLLAASYLAQRHLIFDVRRSPAGDADVDPSRPPDAQHGRPGRTGPPRSLPRRGRANPRCCRPPSRVSARDHGELTGESGGPLRMALRGWAAHRPRPGAEGPRRPVR